MKIYFQKRFGKACEIRKCSLLLHPAKSATFLEKLIRKREESEKIIFQKNFKNFLPVRKELLLLHPLRETHTVG
jgi:hypothetical protein